MFTQKLRRALLVDRAVDFTLLVAASAYAACARGELDIRYAAACFAGGAASWIVAARVVRHYDESSGRDMLSDVALTAVVGLAILAPVAVAWRFVPGWNAAVVMRFAMLLPFMLIARAAIVTRLGFRYDPGVNVVIAGTGALGRLTGKEMQVEEGDKNVLGYLRFDGEPENPRLRAPVLGGLDALQRILEENIVDEVYFASLNAEHGESIQSAISVCERFGVPFALPVCRYRLGRARPACADMAKDGYIHYLSAQLTPYQAAAKRLFDVTASALALLVLSPLLVVIAVLVRLTSRGPILFRQERMGLHGRRFSMLKFRSMVDGAEKLQAALLSSNERSGPAFKMKSDPRTTPIGRILRRYSLDELPQLVNVLRGDMSIVGPRPPIPSEVARYEAWQRRRLSVRPGLTCVWQVSERSGISFEDWMLLDMRYIDHWSLRHDFELILKTVSFVASGSGAT